LFPSKFIIAVSAIQTWILTICGQVSLHNKMMIKSRNDMIYFPHMLLVSVINSWIEWASKKIYWKSNRYLIRFLHDMLSSCLRHWSNAFICCMLSAILGIFRDKITENWLEWLICCRLITFFRYYFFSKARYLGNIEKIIKAFISTKKNSLSD
jgi:hypothetical protein